MKKDAKEDVMENFRLITLLDTELKVLTNMLAKRLALIVGSIVRDAKVSTIPVKLFMTISTS